MIDLWEDKDRKVHASANGYATLCDLPLPDMNFSLAPYPTCDQCVAGLNKGESMRKPIVELDKWSFRTDAFGTETWLIGETIGHPTRPDGEVSETGRLVYISSAVAETENTRYKLLEPSSLHKLPREEMFERLLDTAHKVGVAISEEFGWKLILPTLPNLELKAGL